MARTATPPRSADQGRPGGDGATSTNPAAPGTSRLRESLDQLLARRPSSDLFAEEAAQLILQETHAAAVALLGLDPRGERLRLLATLHLDDAAVRVLAGDPSHPSWDIPLRALRNRRINVIESAQDNPFVPRPLIALNPAQMTIAVLPFYHQGAPTGAVVLFAPTPQAFPDTLLHTLSQALRVCAMGLSELPSAPTTAPSRPAPDTAREQPTLLRGVATLKAELSRLTQALEESEGQRAAEAADRVTAETFLVAATDRVAQLEKELADLRGTSGQLPRLEGAVDQLNRQVHEAQAAAEAARAQAAAMEKQLADAQQRADEDAASIEALTSFREEIQRRFERARAESQDRGAALSDLDERFRGLAEHAETLQKALDALHADRAGLEDELARVREELALTRTQRGKAGAARRESTEALTAAQAESRALATKLAEAEVKLEQFEVAQKSLANLRQQLETGSTERRDLAQRLEAAEAARSSEAREHEAARQTWADQVAGLESERDRFREEMEHLRAQAGETRAELEARLELAEAERRELVERVDALAQTEAERTRVQSRAHELEAELADAREKTRVLEERIKELGEVNARLIAERRELHGRVDALTAGGQTLEEAKKHAINRSLQRVIELESALSRMSKTIDATRSSAAEELDRVRAEADRDTTALRAELAAATQAREALHREFEQRQQAIEAERRAGEDRARETEQWRETARRLEREQSDLVERLNAATKAAGQHQHEQEDAARRLASLESSLREAVTARDSLTAELHETQERMAGAAAKQIAAAEATRRELEIALASERDRRLAEAEELTEQLRQVRGELIEELADMTRRYDLAQLESKRLTQALQDKDQLLSIVETRLSTAEPGGPEAGPEAGLEAGLELELAIEHGGIAAAEPPPTAAEAELRTEETAAATAAPAEPAMVVILDDGEPAATAAGRLGEFGLQVSALAPPPDFAGSIGSRRVACAAVNLSLPGIWKTLRTLRAGEDPASMPLVGYTLAGGANAGFWLGPVDFTVLPLKGKQLVTVLQRLVPKLRRVVAMSNDFDVMTSVRTELTAARISAAVVLDGRQAFDLLPTIRPEAAVLHLSPTCTDVFRAISGLRSSEIGREIPILFLIDPIPQPKEDAFFTIGLRQLSGRGNLKADELVNFLATSFGPYRAE